MKTASLLLIACLFIAGHSNAQKTTKRYFINHTEFGGLFGRVKFHNSYNGNQEQVDNRLSLTVQTFNGIKWTDRLSTGITVGMDWYKMALINPLAAGARYDLVVDGTARFFATADVGYGFTWFNADPEGSKTTGGLMINPGFGLKYGKSSGTTVTISLTYKRQEASVSKPPLWDQIERKEERFYNRLALRLGMAF